MREVILSLIMHEQGGACIADIVDQLKREGYLRG